MLVPKGVRDPVIDGSTEQPPNRHAELSGLPPDLSQRKQVLSALSSSAGSGAGRGFISGASNWNCDICRQENVSNAVV